MEETGFLDDLAWLRRLARTLVRDTATADDAVQDTLIAASGTRRVSRAWLAQTLRNFIRQEHRSRSRRTRREEMGSRVRPSRSPAPDGLLEELESHRLLADEVRALDDPYRETILLRFVREWSPRQIAAHHDVPVKTVHTRIERGLARLRTRLDRRAPRERWLSALALMGEPRVPGFLPVAGLGVTLMSTLTQVSLAAAVVALLGLPFLLMSRRADPVAEPASAPAPERGAMSDPDLQALLPRDGRRPEGSHRPEVASSPADTAATTDRRLVGRVVDVSGAPVGGVGVAFQPRLEGRFLEPADLPTAVSDAEGRFQLSSSMQSGRIDLLGSEWVAVHRPFVHSRRAQRELVLVVSLRSRYSGRVVDEERAPVAGARVAVRLPGRFYHPLTIDDRVLALRNPIVETTTGPEGAFALDAVGYIDGAVLSTSRDGFESTEMDTSPAAALDLEVVLRSRTDEGRSIRGRVLTELGTPASAARVSAGGDSIAVRPDGSFALPVEAWRDVVSLRAIDAEHGATVERLAEPDLQRALAGTPVELLLPGPPRSLRGLVVDEKGLPVPHARVWTPDTTWFGSAPVRSERAMTAVATAEAIASGHPGPFPWTQDTRADEGGEFELRGLSDRAYDVFVAREDRLSAAGPVRAVPGDQPLRLVLPSEPTARVAGVVVDGQGRPLADVAVHVGRDLLWERPVRAHDLWEGSPLQPPSAACGGDQHAVRTDAEGRFEFPALVLQGSWITIRGDEAWMPRRVPLDAAVDPGELRIIARMRAEFEVTCRPDADAFRLESEDGRMQPLLVPVEESTLSTATAAIVGGRSLRAITGAGPVTVVLLRGETVLERRQVALERGAQVLEL
ncbi:MAG: sigma-70 family RNA polymerase sigma factor [Planctomycetota bacterium]